MVRIEMPDAAALSIILRQHLGSDLPHADLAELGQMAFGKSGADCAAAVRAARAKARRAKRPLTEQDLRYALAPNHRALPPAMQRRMAIHEAGHAVVTAALDIASVESLRIGPDGGQIVSRLYPVDMSPREAHRQCVAHLAGRAAELLSHRAFSSLIFVNFRRCPLSFSRSDRLRTKMPQLAIHSA